MRVNGGETDEALARLLIEQSRECAGVDGPSRRALSVGAARHAAPVAHQRVLPRRRQGADERYYAAAARLGIDVCLRRRGRRRSTSSTALRKPRPCTPAAGDADRARRGRGDRVRAGSRRTSSGCARRGASAADNFIVRGTPYNTGTPLRLMLDAGAAADRRSARVPRDRRRRPRAALRRRHRHAPRLRPARHRRQPRTASASTTRAKTSGRSATRSGARSSRAQPDQIAYSIVDAKMAGRFMPSVFPPIVAGSIRELAARAGPAGRAARATVAAFNAAVRPGTFDLATLDDCRTEGLTPPKSHWAQRDRHAAVLGLSAAARDHVHLPWPEGGRPRARRDARHARRATSSRRARSWPATSCGAATSPASA